MINTAVFSYWNRQGLENSSGFNSFKDYMYSQALAIYCAKQHFPEVKFITNGFGKRQIERIGLHEHVTELDTSLSQFDKKLEKYFWGFTKIHAYNQQEVPFIHIDNDFYIWDNPLTLREAEFGFQSPEVFDDDFYRYYYRLIEIMNAAPKPPQIILDNPVLEGQNCGVVAAHRLDIVKQWHDLAWNYIQDNKKHLLTFDKGYRIHLNLCHEQYFISSLLKSHNIEPTHLFVKDNIKEAYRPGNRFTHLWGTIKRDTGIMSKVRLKLRTLLPDMAKRIEQIY